MLELGPCGRGYCPPLTPQADPKFFWNAHLVQELSSAELDGFTIPIVDGFIAHKFIDTMRQPFLYTFVSRRSCDRTGARFHTRGVDPRGKVANYVETEQLVSSPCSPTDRSGRSFV